MLLTTFEIMKLKIISNKIFIKKRYLNNWKLYIKMINKDKDKKLLLKYFTKISCLEKKINSNMEYKNYYDNKLLKKIFWAFKYKYILKKEVFHKLKTYKIINNFRNVNNKLYSGFKLWKNITKKKKNIILEVNKLKNLLTGLDNDYKINYSSLKINTNINQYKIDKNNLSLFFKKWLYSTINYENNTENIYLLCKKYMKIWLNNYRKYKKLRNKNNIIRKEIKKIIYNFNLLTNIFSYWKYKTKTQSYNIWRKYN